MGRFLVDESRKNYKHFISAVVTICFVPTIDNYKSYTNAMSNANRSGDIGVVQPV